MNIGQLSLFIFLLRPHWYSTCSWRANNVYELNGYVFEVKENAVSWMLVCAARVSLIARVRVGIYSYRYCNLSEIFEPKLIHSIVGVFALFPAILARVFLVLPDKDTVLYIHFCA